MDYKVRLLYAVYHIHTDTSGRIGQEIKETFYRHKLVIGMEYVHIIRNTSQDDSSQK